jgi:hypothetical protein
MNCKPGDLAVIVRAYRFPELVGRIVTCVRLTPHPSKLPVWETAEPLPESNWIHDDQLRPIRDNDGEDEMLRIVGKPETAVA